LLVAEHRLERIEIGVGTQHEDAIEFLLFLDLVEIDREVLIADRLQITPKIAVADQRLVAFGKLVLQRGEDRSAVGGILFGFLTIAEPKRTPAAVTRSISASAISNLVRAVRYSTGTPARFNRDRSLVQYASGKGRLAEASFA
jgi:hypothetical protein